jgi:hypothetical protein
LDWENKNKTKNDKIHKNTMKNLIIFAALLTGLVSCTERNPIKVLTIQRMDGQVQQIKSTISLNVKGDSIMLKDTYFSGNGLHTAYYGNFGVEVPEDYYNCDSIGVVSMHYEPAVVLKVEVD